MSLFLCLIVLWSYCPQISMSASWAGTTATRTPPVSTRTRSSPVSARRGGRPLAAPSSGPMDASVMVNSKDSLDTESNHGTFLMTFNATRSSYLTSREPRLFIHYEDAILWVSESYYMPKTIGRPSQSYKGNPYTNKTVPS